jgi:glutaconate CoA-transferase subunit A
MKDSVKRPPRLPISYPEEQASMSRSKQIPLDQVPRYIQDGDRLWLGGWTVVRKPFAMAYEIIRSGKKNLHLVNNPGGPETDLLIGCGCAAKTETNYIGHELFGHPYNFRRRLERPDANQSFRHDDWTVATGSLRIMAGAMGIPFIPTRFLRGTDILNPELDGFSDLRGIDPKVPKRKFMVLKDPFWEGEDVILIPSIRPDVCLIHAQEAGKDGTVRITGGVFLDYYAAVASKVTIVSAERIVSKEALEATREENAIPGEAVHAVVEVPFGGHPTAVHGCYDNDPWWFRDYLKASKSADTMKRWADEWIFRTGSFRGYLEKVGRQRLDRITADPALCYSAVIKRRLDKLEDLN